MTALAPTATAAPRIVVAMSGGVDSSLAAALLVEAGADVVGVTMHLAGEASRCCSLDDADDARRVAERLGIRFYVANYTEPFREEVMVAFADAYLSGRTPIPCVACNKRFKFDHLMERARMLGAGAVATGHYARVERDAETGRFVLRRAADRRKDQTYFLFQLDQSQLARVRFPLGGLGKDEVRRRARALGLATADKPESQEICFVPDGDYASVVEAIRPEAREQGGEIVDASGRVLGRHAGVHRFTIGQRHGLGISADRRLYVTGLDPGRRRVVVGDVEDLGVAGMEVSAVNWISGETPAGAVRARVQVRYRHDGEEARVEALDGGRARVIFDRPVRA
ncbi:MAG TPA: tRNA 2-thiouridine(34) synthase MnmA, partial [Alphaproteobacteria bacterium]|nr:tRNA 2-thiouridine(34) synthase MnmA [Alphaproteobacteria bacterium]